MFAQGRVCHESDGSPLDAPYVAFRGRVTASAAIQGVKRLWPNSGLVSPLPLLPVTTDIVQSILWAQYASEGATLPVYGFLLSLATSATQFVPGIPISIRAWTSVVSGIGPDTPQDGTEYSIIWYPDQADASLAFFPVSILDGVSSLHVDTLNILSLAGPDPDAIGEMFNFEWSYSSASPASVTLNVAPITDPHAARLLGVAACAPLLAAAFALAQGLPYFVPNGLGIWPPP